MTLLDSDEVMLSIVQNVLSFFNPTDVLAMLVDSYELRTHYINYKVDYIRFTWCSPHCSQLVPEKMPLFPRTSMFFCDQDIKLVPFDFSRLFSRIIYKNPKLLVGVQNDGYCASALNIEKVSKIQYLNFYTTDGSLAKYKYFIFLSSWFRSDFHMEHSFGFMEKMRWWGKLFRIHLLINYDWFFCTSQTITTITVD